MMELKKGNITIGHQMGYENLNEKKDIKVGYNDNEEYKTKNNCNEYGFAKKQ